ncbi:MAG: protein translocase subunit SecD [Actinomycetota bacterium]|nr:protein translocase subunit SecD [Actinomycetota bacterium]
MKRSSLIMVLATVVISLGAFFAVLALNYKPVLGLDLQGGLSVVYAPAHPVNQATLNETISIISNRVNGLGVAEPNISAQGHNIVVQLPGVKDPQAALKVVGQTATLRFRPVLCSTTAYVAPPKSLHLTAAELQPTCPTSATNSNLLSYVPSTTSQSDTATANVLLPHITNNVVTARYVLGPTLMTGASLKTAVAGLDSTGNWIVQFTLTSTGSPLFDSIAKQYYQKNIAIVLDGNVISAPTINSTSFGGHGQISGAFNQSQADNLALVLRYGALPVQLVQQTVQTISPTLGAASLKAGVFAGLIGLIAVMIYTILYYRALGVVVVTGLATTAALLWAIISYIGHSSGLTLDLSGVTGLIVSIGVTVDSYIVFFERLKDDVRDGRSIRASIDRSFKKAFRTIVAADLVSFIGALLLYLLSIGPVRGFAFFLGLSTILDVITSYTFTRPLVILLGRSETFTRARWFGVARGLAVSNV